MSIANLADLNIQFAVCVVSEAESDLEAWKIYRTLPDPSAIAVGCLRVIDESGEDYLYPKDRFAIVELPEAVREKLLATVAEQAIAAF